MSLPDSESGVFAADGPFAGLIDGYAPRPQQVEMAEAIAAALRDREVLVCEAGTGTGKTFAYLVPALQSGLKVLVSTGTRHLQDQLFHRDLPVVQRALRLPVNVQLLKGRANYLCLLRLAQHESDPAALGRESAARLPLVREWAVRTRSGDLAELSAVPEDSPVMAAITSTTDNCLGQACRFYEDCFVFEARRRAAHADITVVNHHLLLSDVSLRERGYGELLPDVDAVIFDEAHQLPELASRFFSRTLTAHQFTEFVRDSRASWLQEAADAPEMPALIDAIEKGARDLRLSFGRTDRRVAWDDINGAPAVRESLRALLDAGQAAHDGFTALSERGKQIENCARRLGELVERLDAFNERGGADQVQWLELRGHGFMLHETPLDISGQFQASIAGLAGSAIYTSATLSVNGDFAHFSSQLDLAESRCLRWESPFDFERQAMLYLPEGLPDPRQEGFTERVVQAALPVIELTRGRAFVLFTSHRALNLAARGIREAVGFPVLVQGEAPRTELLERFREAGHAVLLGTSSFWEGVDVKGQALSCVIIDKLPFAAPDDPVLRARMQRLEAQGRSPFKEYQMPQAVIELRQGIGRLIRDPADYGVLMICDPRLRTRSYGKVFLNSLPAMSRSTDLEAVRAFFRQHES